MDLDELPTKTNALERIVEEERSDGTTYIITACAKGGVVFNNHKVNYHYDWNQSIALLSKVDEGEVVHGTITVREGQIIHPVSKDALVKFSENQPLFPAGHYISMIAETLCGQDTEMTAFQLISFVKAKGKKSDPIPQDMEIQKHWKNHEIVTDEMVAHLKKTVGCEAHHALRDVSAERYFFLVGKHIPEGKVAWEKVDTRSGAMNVFRENMVLTDKNGRNPVSFDEAHKEQLEKEAEQAAHKELEKELEKDFEPAGRGLSTSRATSQQHPTYYVKWHRVDIPEGYTIVREENQTEFYDFLEQATNIDDFDDTDDVECEWGREVGVGERWGTVTVTAKDDEEEDWTVSGEYIVVDYDGSLFTLLPVCRSTPLSIQRVSRDDILNGRVDGRVLRRINSKLKPVPTDSSCYTLRNMCDGSSVKIVAIARESPIEAQSGAEALYEDLKKNGGNMKAALSKMAKVVSSEEQSMTTFLTRFKLDKYFTLKAEQLGLSFIPLKELKGAYTHLSIRNGELGLWKGKDIEDVRYYEDEGELSWVLKDMVKGYCWPNDPDSDSDDSDSSMDKYYTM